MRTDGLWQAMTPPLDPPRAPILKCFLYLNDVGLDQGPTAVLRGSHRLPWAPDGIYDLHRAGYKGFTGAAVRRPPFLRRDVAQCRLSACYSGQGFAGAPPHHLLYNEESGYCPTASLVNKMVFAAKAGDVCIFDIATCVYALYDNTCACQA